MRISRVSVLLIVRRVAKTISIQLLGPKYIIFPVTENEVTEAVTKFELSRAHVFIKRPSKDSTDFLKRKNRYSLNIQAVCDHNYCFKDVVVKWPSSVHDAKCFFNSTISKLLIRNGIIPRSEKKHCRCRSSGTRLSDWGSDWGSGVPIIVV